MNLKLEKRPLQGAFLIPPALLVVADCCSHDLHMSFNRPSASAGQATPKRGSGPGSIAEPRPGPVGGAELGGGDTEIGHSRKGACLGPAHFDDRGGGRQLVVFESSSVNLVDAQNSPRPAHLRAQQKRPHLRPDGARGGVRIPSLEALTNPADLLLAIERITGISSIIFYIETGSEFACNEPAESS